MSKALSNSTRQAVECRGLEKAYDRSPVLHSLTLSVQTGEKVAVFGPNGAGKTTLIKLLAGLLRPTDGSVRLWGRQPWGNGGGAVRARVGLVGHQSYLYEELSARENLSFYARLYGVADGAVRIEQALATFDLEHRAHQAVRTLSRGLQQRVALARATLHEPQVLLLDEPDTGLDPSAQESLHSFVAQGGPDLTVLMATHNVDMGLALCERSVVLTEGHLAYDSTEEAGIRRSKVLGFLLGSNDAA